MHTEKTKTESTAAAVAEPTAAELLEDIEQLAAENEMLRDLVDSYKISLTSANASLDQALQVIDTLSKKLVAFDHDALMQQAAQAEAEIAARAEARYAATLATPSAN